MRILFIRHGEPDYVRDCLTDEGQRQAEAAAVRLSGEGITRIFSSPNGRARLTAAATARRLGLPVVILDYMHEITWGGADIPADGHPWTLGDWLLEREDFDFRANDWREHPYFKHNAATEDYRRVTARFDALLEGFGYRHEGRRFFCESAGDETVALFSHGGSGACVLAHLLALPFPYVASVMPYDFTSIISVVLPAREGEYVHPRLELFNDAAHIRRRADAPTLQEKPDR